MAESSNRNRKEWKDHLLRSGVPLEYEVARLLAKEGMFIDADFSFFRKDGPQTKELSVDVSATWFGPNDNNLLYELHLLIECKYRAAGKFILLLEDPNELSPQATLGGTINSFDTFVRYYLPRDSFIPLEKKMPYVYKAIEIHNGGAVEEDIRRGIHQLRYATPALLRQTFETLMYDEDRRSLFFSKILVTNAPLRILSRGANLEKIRMANNIEDISTEVRTAILFSDYGPDYEDHFRLCFSENSDNRKSYAKQIRSRLQAEGKQMTMFCDPVSLMEDFSQANRIECRSVGTQFFITTIDGLSDLLADIKKGCRNSYSGRTKTDSLLKEIRKIKKSPVSNN